MAENKIEESRKCPNCNSEKIRKAGLIIKRNRTSQRYQCAECGITFQ